MPNPNKPAIEPASTGESMRQFCDWLRTYSKLTPKNVYEIGANLAQDAAFIKDYFSIDDQNVWVFEPHPELISIIREDYNFQAYDYAIGEEDGRIILNAIRLDKNSNSGISSVRESRYFQQEEFIQVDVKACRMDTFLEQHGNPMVDFLKLDVEGNNYEVLRGFGEKIVNIECMHIEAEHVEGWRGQKLWDDIRRILEPHFSLVYFQRHFTQSDSFWIKEKYIQDEPMARRN